MFTLENIIDSKAGREIKRAIAVKMVSQGFLVKDICELLDVSDAFVSKWKRIYEEQGAKGLRLRYQGSTGFLTPHQRGEVILHLKNQTHFSVDELRDFIERRYGVVYQSKQSYYDLLKDAGISWHRTEPVNPKRDEAKVLQKREEIKSIILTRATGEQSRKLIFHENNQFPFALRVARVQDGGEGGMNALKCPSRTPKSGKLIMG